MIVNLLPKSFRVFPLALSQTQSELRKPIGRPLPSLNESSNIFSTSRAHTKIPRNFFRQRDVFLFSPTKGLRTKSESHQVIDRALSLRESFGC